MTLMLEHPTAIEVPSGSARFRELSRTLLTMEVPAGYRAEASDKAPVHGKAGVPVYLLLDMQEETATVFWQPSSHGYVSRLTVPFGEPVRIPAPFDCDLDTSAFAAPAEQAEAAT